MQWAAVSTNLLPIKDPPQLDGCWIPAFKLKYRPTIQGSECGFTSQVSGPPILVLTFVCKQSSPDESEIYFMKASIPKHLYLISSRPFLNVFLYNLPEQLHPALMISLYPRAFVTSVYPQLMARLRALPALLPSLQ